MLYGQPLVDVVVGVLVPTDIRFDGPVVEFFVFATQVGHRVADGLHIFWRAVRISRFWRTIHERLPCPADR